MNFDWQGAWAFLQASSVFMLSVTLLAYLAGLWFYRRCHYHPAATPVLMAVILVMMGVWLADVPYANYFEGVKLLHFLLGPSTVALAVPLYGQLPRLRRLFQPIMWSLAISSIFAALSAVGVSLLLGANREIAYSFAPKSVTTPIAMGIAELTGGIPSLSAAFVIVTGVLGAMVAPWVFRFVGVSDPVARGFAMGLAAHGVGTAQAFQENETSGAFAALAMGLNGAFTALTLPWILKWLSPWLI